MENIEHILVKKPWGQFDRFTLNKESTVKIITVLAGGSLSLQKHQNRSEFWYIVSGKGIVTIGDKKIEAKPLSEFYIPKDTNHRIEAIDNMKFLEIAFGDNFTEEDIVRIEDKYGRN